jgi:hypothetical protein
MFSSEVIAERQNVAYWVFSKYIKTDKESRKLKYIGVYLINDWVSKN